MTCSEHTRMTVRSAWTVATSQVRTSAGRIAIANVWNTCWPSHGSGAAVTSPEISTRPFQHSGVAGQRAVPPVTSAAGQFAATVATPYTDGGVAASDGGVAALAPAALVAAAAWPAGMLAPLRAGPSEAGPFWPMS